MMLVRIHIDNYSELVRNQSKNTVSIPILVLNILKEQMDAFKNGEVFDISEGDFVIIFNENEQALKLINEISNVMQLYLNISVSFGISEIFNDFRKIKKYLLQAESALNKKFISGNASINWFWDSDKESNHRETHTNIYSLAMENRLFDMLSTLKRDEAKAIVSDVLNAITDSSISKKEAMVSIIEVLNTFVRVSKVYGAIFMKSIQRLVIMRLKWLNSGNCSGLSYLDAKIYR